MSVSKASGSLLKKFDTLVISAAVLICFGQVTALAAGAPLELQRYVSSVREAGAFSGVMLAARGDKIILHEAFGYADFELRVGMQTSNIFKLASLTKPLTASAALVAVDSGRLTLDSSICAYIDYCPDTWNSVKISHLLSHSSGIQDYFGDLRSVAVEDTRKELDRVLVGFTDQPPLTFEPGSRYEYSNFNYVLIGAALERIFEAPWEDVLNSLIFSPIGMSDTGYDDVYEILPRRAHGYDRSENGIIRNVPDVDHAAYAAGGLRATASDTFKWSRAVFKGSLWSDSLREKAFTAYNDQYGYGWAISKQFERSLYNHTGRMGGSSTHIAYYPEEDLTIIVLSNIQSENAYMRACDLASVALGLKRGRHDDIELALKTFAERCGAREDL